MWLAIAAFFVAIGYGSWKVKRYVNYKFMYQSQVDVQLKPLLIRIDDLDKRVKALENKLPTR